MQIKGLRMSSFKFFSDVFWKYLNSKKTQKVFKKIQSFIGTNNFQILGKRYRKKTILSSQENEKRSSLNEKINCLSKNNLFRLHQILYEINSTSATSPFSKIPSVFGR